MAIVAAGRGTVSNADTTTKGIVEEATQAEVDAGTATGGTGARLYTNPSAVQTKYTLGAMAAAVVKTYLNFHLLLISDAGVGPTASGGASVTSGGLEARLGTVTGTVATADGGFFLTDTVGGLLGWNSTNVIIMDWWALLPATSTGDICMGIGSGTSSAFADVYNSTTKNRVQFCLRGSTGVLYATVSKNTVGVTNTDVSTGMVAGKWNNFRIELTLGTSALFYINGVLVATLSGANFPTATAALIVGFGNSASAASVMTAPNISIQMNP